MHREASPDTGKWQIQDKEIVLNTAGVLKPASASDIVGAEFKGRKPFAASVTCGKPTDDLQDIKFHRFPLEVRLAVSPPTEQHPAWLAIQATGQGQSCALPDLDRDQILVDDMWFPLTAADLSDSADAMSAAKISGPGRLTLRQYLDLASSRRRTVDIQPLNSNANCSSTAEAGSGSQSDAIPGLKAVLYPYQRAGVQWLRRIAAERIGGILGDEMGLGKTIQILAVLEEQSKCGHGASLIIAPATLLENWRREMKKFTPDLNSLVHQGSDRTGFPKELLSYDAVITSYETAVRDSGLMGMIEWNFVVLDEAQAIKNPDTQRSNAVKELTRNVSIAVTGTPVENRLRDLWSLMDFACPGLLGDLSTFEKTYDDVEADAEELEPVVSPLILRRLVKDVAKDLPERIDIPQSIQMPDREIAIYESIRQQIIDEYGKSATLVSLTKLRMFCTHPSLVDHGQTDPAKVSAKYRRLIEILDEIVLQGHKTIIFTSFSDMIDLMKQDLTKRYPIHCESIDGRTEIGDRQAIVDTFQNATCPSVLILNPRAAGTGLNITAANNVIHYNLEWNPAIEDQATARAYRRGQKRPVTVHRLYYPDTVEEVIDARVEHKRNLASSAVVGTDGDDPSDIARALGLSPQLSGGNEL